MTCSKSQAFSARKAVAADLESVSRLHAAQSHRSSWPSQIPEETGDFILQGILGGEWPPAEYDIFVSQASGEVSGFLIMKKQLTRGLTGDRESIVYESITPDPAQEEALFSLAVEAARLYGSQFLTTQVEPLDTARASFLDSLGFQLESHRISVASGVPPLPRQSPYQVRPVSQDDAFLIGVLNSTMLEHTLSAGREYDMGSLTMESMGSVMGRVSQNSASSDGLVLTLKGEMVGHLLLEITDRLGYIYDLALAREHWGGTAVRHLMRSGSALLHSKGIPLFVGDVSASNRRALVVAQRALGFQIDFHRYGLLL